MQQLNTNTHPATTGQDQPITPKTPKTPGSFPIAATGKPSQDETVPLFCRQYKIICKNSIGKVVLREFDSIECDGTVVIEGLYQFFVKLINMNIFEWYLYQNYKIILLYKIIIALILI